MKQLITAIAFSSTVAFVPVSVQATDASSASAGASKIEQGKYLAFSGAKGNCLACHAIKGGELAGTTGSPLVMMAIRYKNKQALRNKIWGTPETRIKGSLMPPFGLNGVLTEKEIDLITDFIHSL